MEKHIALADLQRAQEHSFMGGPPERNPMKPEEWYKPQGVLTGVFTMDEVIKARKKLGHFKFGLFNELLQIADRRQVSVGFSDIDEKTGMTLDDPKIIGLWDEGKGEIVKVKGRDLTQEAYEIHKGAGVDLHLRESKTVKEGRASSPEQKA